MKYTENQQKAIDTIDQNLQIIACAGSGKTQVISQRIINILKSGIIPKNIIAFTYTEKAAGELKTRVLRLCKEQLPDITGLAEMYIGTIHAWCLNILQDYKYEFQKFSVLDEVKLMLFIDRNFKNIGMTDLDMSKFKDTKRFITLMGILREAEFKEKLTEEYIEALDKYENTLLKNGYMDFTMIMTKAIEYIKNDEQFRQKIKENSGYLIVDEYQDVNPVQEQIINELYQLDNNICVVGDDDQTIFQWRGSHIGYIQNFKERYDNVESIVLNDNFRSSKAVIDVAVKCISNNEKRLDKNMIASGKQCYDRGDILFNSFESVNDENKFIVDSIRNLRGVKFQDKEGKKERGLDYSDCVILIRKWKKAEAIIQKFQEEKIPFIVGGVNNLFMKAEVKAAQQIFLFLDRKIDSSVLLNSWTGLSDKIEKKKVEEAISILEKKLPLGDYYENFNIQEIFMNFLKNAGIKEESFVGNNENSVAGYENEEVIFYNLGMFSQIINDFEIVNFKTKPSSKLTIFLNFLTYVADGYYPEGWLNNSYKTPNAVQIMTIYQAKGLEFPVVFVPGLNKNYMPTSQPTGKQVWHFIDKELIKGYERYFPSTEDERRLMYVAITRAKKYLIMSRSPDGRMQRKESIFCSEVRKSDYVITNTHRDYSEREKTVAEANTEISNITLNFSLLKSFFECPYSFKFYKFYGFCDPLGARIGYGKTLHNSLMELHREILEGNIIKREELNGLIEKHKHFPYATDVMIESMTERANKSLEIYYDNNEKDFDKIEFAEKEIQLDLGDGILVNGQMDLIKKNNLDGTFEKTIIDFKSTEDSQEYNATIDQLKLYALGYKELTGENADFLEIYNLDNNDKHKNELIINDLDDMKQKIINAANSIRDNHLDHTCNDVECVCRFKK